MWQVQRRERAREAERRQAVAELAQRVSGLEQQVGAGGRSGRVGPQQELPTVGEEDAASNSRG